jgi:hypothetical protein
VAGAAPEADELALAMVRVEDAVEGDVVSVIQRVPT